MNTSDIIYTIWLLALTVCLTFLFSKGCDYEHVETMKHIEMKCEQKK